MSPDDLGAEGWADVVISGVRTVVDLRNDYEVSGGVERPIHLAVVRRPVEDQADEEFMELWGERLGSPAYYPEIVRRWPDLIVAAIAAIADAPTGVLFHCGAGRDRTGMITAILLDLVGVDRAAILDDYELAVRDYNEWLTTNRRRELPLGASQLDGQVGSSRDELSQFLESMDVEGFLLDAGVTRAQVHRIRARLLSE
jgi:protein-tyrosine phosphatase